MAKSLKTLLLVGIVAVVAACAQQEEPAPEPVIFEEPVSEKF